MARLLRGCSRMLWSNYVLKCKRSNRFWGLSETEFLELTQSHCHYCGVEPRQRLWKRGAPSTWLYNGIDRKDNLRGYFADNCVACCGRCNKMKGDHLSHDEMVAIGNVLIKLREQAAKP